MRSLSHQVPPHHKHSAQTYLSFSARNRPSEAQKKEQPTPGSPTPQVFPFPRVWPARRALPRLHPGPLREAADRGGAAGARGAGGGLLGARPPGRLRAGGLLESRDDSALVAIQTERNPRAAVRSPASPRAARTARSNKSKHRQKAPAPPASAGKALKLLPVKRSPANPTPAPLTHPPRRRSAAAPQ